ATLGLLTAACGGDDSAGTEKDVTLRVNLFGKFGYTELYKQFEKDHPGVTIVETAEGDLGAFNTQLTQRIAAGSGAGDVVAIEEGQVINFLQKPDNFVNLQDHGSEDMKDQWLGWKYDQATTADGTYTIGLGTDVGGLAMCYRRDLFEQAGLPTEREEVGALWPTWEDYIETGKKFAAGIGDEKVHFVDSATNTYNSILMQSGDHTYFDRDDSLVIESNPAVRSAWETSIEMVDAGLSAKLKAFSNEWNAGFKSGAFATLACPAWMTGYIADQAGDAGKGKWDIATVPGGGGNWGGSFLAVPTSSENQKVAIELVKFLTSGDSQLAAFEAVGNLPSNPTLYGEDALGAATNEYFNDAPVGELFVAGAESLEPVYLGAKNQPVRDSVENALRSVESGSKSTDEGWQEAVKAAEKAAG
ncbi:MAG: extracellular solute-binding protein, partial [Propionibacteriales bacterium]|nr:extracellular solute-binding protein [Propionibacteriales bacterium]